MKNWQSTLRAHARREAATRYPRRLVRELTAIIQEGPGFIDEDARRRFPGCLWEWAAGTLLHTIQYPELPPPKAAGRSLAQFDGTVRKALHKWADMPDEQRRWVASRAAHLRCPPPTGDPAVDTANLEEAIETALKEIPRCLVYLVHAADCAEIDHEVWANPRRRRERHALAALAELWTDVTGRKPTRTVDYSYRCGRRGAFLDFVDKALGPAFPEMGSLGGLIEQVTNPKKPKAAIDSKRRKSSP